MRFAHVFCNHCSGPRSWFCPIFLWCQGPGKIPWTLKDVKEVALDIKMSMPISVTSVVTSAEWKGGAMVQLEDMISRPTAADLVVNHCFLRPFIRKFPQKVCSAFFATDVFLYLDQCFVGRLLQPVEEGDTKKTMAGEEGKKVKSLVGYLRYLWRSSVIAEFKLSPFRTCGFHVSVCFLGVLPVVCAGKTGAHPKVADLKSLLVASPTRARAWHLFWSLLK